MEKCGLNADWACDAWQVTPGTPNRSDGAVFILDDELDAGTFTVVRRWFVTEDGRYDDRALDDMGDDPEAFDYHNNAIVELASGLTWKGALKTSAERAYWQACDDFERAALCMADDATINRLGNARAKAYASLYRAHAAIRESLKTDG